MRKVRSRIGKKLPRSCKCQSQYSDLGSVILKFALLNHFFTALLLKLWILNLKYVEKIQTSHWQHLVEAFFSAKYRVAVGGMMKRAWLPVSSLFMWGCILSHSQLGVPQCNSDAQHAELVSDSASYGSVLQELALTLDANRWDPQAACISDQTNANVWIPLALFRR